MSFFLTPFELCVEPHIATDGSVWLSRVFLNLLDIFTESDKFSFFLTSLILCEVCPWQARTWIAFLCDRIGV